MKKYNLFKILGIFFLGIVLLSWLIPASTISNGTFAQGALNPIGLLDLVKLPLNTIGSYYGYGLFILVLGGFYGVINATGVYTKLVDKTVELAKKNQLIFLVATIVGFALLTALSGVNYVVFILVPFFLTVLTLLGYNKLSVLASTVGAILVGNFASVYGFSINGYVSYFFQINMNNLMWAKVLLFAFSTAALAYFVIITDAISKLEEKKVAKAKKTTKTKKAEMDVVSVKKVKDNGKGIMPLLVILGVTLLFLFVSTYNWRYGLNTFVFEQLYQSMLEVKVFGFAIIDGLVGNVYPLGYWSQLDVALVLLFASGLIAWIYSLKLDATIEAFIDGAKEMLEPALYVTLASITLAFVSSAAGSDFFNTIAQFLLTLTKSFNVFTAALMTVFGSLVYNDFSYFTSVVVPHMSSLFTNTADYPLAGLVLQTFHGLMMFVLPTSLFLVAGLSILKVSFVDWIKYIWQLVLQLLAVAAFVIILVIIF